MSEGYITAASLFGFGKDGATLRAPSTDDHMWSIRSYDYVALVSHMQDMYDMGFTLGPITKSIGWIENALPPGIFFFSARIPKADLSDEDLVSLREWDKAYAGDEVLEQEAT